MPPDHRDPKKDGLRYVLINRNATKAIWFPDLYVDKAKDLRNPVYQIPPADLKFIENHKMFYNRRINYDLSCPMQFKNYPLRFKKLW